MITRQIVKGHLIVCAHRVEYWWDAQDLDITDELRERLEEDAESRAKECIVDGYIAGELCTVHVNHDQRDAMGRFARLETELRGWWRIS